MPRRACCWTRKMEIDLVDFVRQKECIWKPLGNTNYHIQQKYRAYAEFAERLGRGFTARSVRDRWVNIRSTFNHNVRRVERSKEEAASMADIFTPCWPLWKPLQFLRNNSKKDVEKCEGMIIEQPYFGLQNQPDRTEERPSNEVSYEIKQKPKEMKDHIQNINLSNSKKCVQVIDNLISAIQPIINNNDSNIDCKSYWYFGRYVTERLNNISQMDAVCASQRIVELINKWPLFSEYSGQFVF